MADEAPKDAKPIDVVLLRGPTEDGEGMRVLRARDERIELGEVRPLKDGKPIAGEIVQLSPRAGAPALCDVEVVAKIAPAAALAQVAAAAPGVRDAKGPAKVSSPAYRTSWERIFGQDEAVTAPSPSPGTLN